MKKFLKKVVIAALTWEATFALRKYKPKIITITGSVGKTTTKDAVYSAISSTFSIRKSEKSITPEIGVPLTILGLPNGRSNPFLWLKNIVEGFIFIIFPFKYPKWLVLEIGAERPGDIETITKWLKPHIVIITRFGKTPAHIEAFPSIEDLINEKGQLAYALNEKGILIYNNDDERVVAFSKGILHKKIAYGFVIGSEVHASNETILYAPYENSEIEFPEGMSFKINYEGISIPMRIDGALGKQHIYPALAAFTIGVSLGISADTMRAALAKYIPPRGRMRLISGNKTTLIIDDTYNSSPVAVHAALTALYELKTLGRKIVVLGDMLELGNYSIDEHKKAGAFATKIANILITVGVRARGIAEGALDAGMDENKILQFETATEAGRFLETIINQGDIILVKGSQAMRMERVVEEIMANPEQKENLLVRQSGQWINRKLALSSNG
jgi:UDP-N-acetylmuramoyl-tripeptide--D-alanyl-D-alanine ligase